MSMPMIEIRPNSISGTAMVFLSGNQCGKMWMTLQGCCYKHTNRDYVLSTDDTSLIVAIMRGVEALKQDDER